MANRSFNCGSCAAYSAGPVGSRPSGFCAFWPTVNQQVAPAPTYPVAAASDWCTNHSSITAAGSGGGGGGGGGGVVVDDDCPPDETPAPPRRKAARKKAARSAA